MTHPGAEYNHKTITEGHDIRQGTTLKDWDVLWYIWLNYARLGLNIVDRVLSALTGFSYGRKGSTM